MHIPLRRSLALAMAGLRLEFGVVGKSPPPSGAGKRARTMRTLFSLASADFSPAPFGPDRNRVGRAVLSLDPAPRRVRAGPLGLLLSSIAQIAPTRNHPTLLQ